MLDLPRFVPVFFFGDFEVAKKIIVEMTREIFSLPVERARDEAAGARLFLRALDLDFLGDF